MADRMRRESEATRSLLERIRSDARMTRREYLRILVTVSGGLVAGTAAVAAGLFGRHGAVEAPRKKVADALRPGESAYFSYPTPDDQAIAIRLADGRLVAYSAVCTHLACSVLWSREAEELECPCHDGVFDPSDGHVVAGPPPRALPSIRIHEDDDGIWAVGTET